MTRGVKILLFLLLCQWTIIKAQEIEIQYLANEGVLIKSQHKKILIDAIFKMEFDYLDVLPDDQLSKIGSAQAPYKSVDLILATHIHGDHFNAQLVGGHLLANKKTSFLGPKEVVDDFGENFDSFDKISSRVQNETPEIGTSINAVINGVSIRALRLRHFGDKPWSEAENVAYLINIDGYKILHVGDAKIDVENLANFNLKDENIDVAILPYWQLGSLEQKEIIDKYINPKQILVAHIPPKSYDSAQDNVNSLNYENAIALTGLFKTIILKR